MYRGWLREHALLLRLDGVWVFGCGCIRSLISVVSPRALFPGRHGGREGVGDAVWEVASLPRAVLPLEAIAVY